MRVPITTRPLSWWAQHFKFQQCSERRARRHIKSLIRSGAAVLLVNGEVVDYDPVAYLFSEDSLLSPQGEWLTGVYLAIDIEKTILF